MALHNIMPPRCACGSPHVEHGYNFERHGYEQLCEVCGLEMFWSSDLLTSDEVDAMHAAYRAALAQKPRRRSPRKPRNIPPFATEGRATDSKGTTQCHS